jgi:hypothetical protein
MMRAPRGEDMKNTHNKAETVNAAISDMKYIAEKGNRCEVCAHAAEGYADNAGRCKFKAGDCFDWRGPANHTTQQEAQG